MPFRWEGLLVRLVGGLFLPLTRVMTTPIIRAKNRLFQTLKLSSQEQSVARASVRLAMPGHTLKLSPHEQLALALGFENLNPPATILPE